MKLNQNTISSRQSLLREAIFNASGILHLGAHLGQEAAKYAQLKKPILWVEAIPAVCAELIKRLVSYPEQNAFCALLDRVDGLQRTFKISNNMGGVSSSIFDFDEYGDGDKSLWPDLQLKMIDQIILPTVKLDTLLAANAVNAADYDFWVVDLQGAELLALQGSEQSLMHCQGLYVEVSKVPVYNGGVLWGELSQYLSSKGFSARWQPELGHDDVLFLR